MAHRMVEPYVEVDNKIKKINKGVLIIENRDVLFSNDLVINSPNLSNYPLRMILSEISDHEMDGLCIGKSSAILTDKNIERINDYFDFYPKKENIIKGNSMFINCEMY